MSGFPRMNEFDTAIYNQKKKIAKIRGHYYPATIFGCECAKQMLRNLGLNLYPGLTGWEIVHLANQELLKEGES